MRLTSWPPVSVSAPPPPNEAHFSRHAREPRGLAALREELDRARTELQQLRQEATKLRVEASQLRRSRAELRERLEGLEAEEIPSLDALGDAHQILRHHPPGAEIEVAHLAVAHLAGRKPDGEPAGVEERPRLRGPEPVPHRRVAELDGIALARGAVAPAVEHHEQHRAGARSD